ncbi:MAG: Fe2+-dependent dioxygenase [Pseudomonadota bacterium]
MLIRIAGLLDATALTQAQRLLDAAAWDDGRATAGPQAARVKNNQQLARGSEASITLQDMVLGALERNTGFFAAALPKRVLPPQFNRYGGDQNFYGAHVDQAVRFVPGGAEKLRSDISATLFLSDPLSYDGGELVIDHSFGEQRIKLEAGDLVLYPGSSVHRVEPVTRGVRLASFFWIESMVRQTEQRRLLWELDGAISALRARHGEGEETVRLTGVYHNLLREWADT